MQEIKEYIEHKTNYISFDVKWMPTSAKIVCVGRFANNHGVISCLEMNKNKLNSIHESEKNFAFKCCTFGASFLDERNIATGDFQGQFAIWDIQSNRTEIPIYLSNKHKGVVNSMDAIGGGESSLERVNAPEIATGGQDKMINIWDIRQKERPVLNFEGKTDCWSVALFDDLNDPNRFVASGFSDGTVNIYDLRANKLYSSHILSNSKGIVSLEFKKNSQEKSISLIATTPNSQIYYLNENEEKRKEMIEESHHSTIWSIKHLPQNPSYFATSSGVGSIQLYKYHQKSIIPVISKKLSNSIPSFDWSPDKKGLFASTDFQNKIIVGFITNLS